MTQTREVTARGLENDTHEHRVRRSHRGQRPGRDYVTRAVLVAYSLYRLLVGAAREIWDQGEPTAATNHTFAMVGRGFSSAKAIIIETPVQLAPWPHLVVIFGKADGDTIGTNHQGKKGFNGP